MDLQYTFKATVSDYRSVYDGIYMQATFIPRSISVTMESPMIIRLSLE